MYLSKQSIPIKATLVTIILIVMGGFYLFSRTFAKPEGYCEEMQRFLTDEEFIQNAIHSTWSYPEKRKPDIDGSPLSAKRFYKAHPHCCKIERRIAREQWGQKWQAVVGMTYETKVKDYSRSDPDQYVEFVVMDECGSVQY